MNQEQKDRIASAIRNFHARALAAQAVLDAVDDVLDITPESKLNQAVWDLVGGYISALDAAYSIGPWLEWWWNECTLGEKPGMAGIRNEPMRKIRTLDDLIGIALDDLALGEVMA